MPELSEAVVADLPPASQLIGVNKRTKMRMLGSDGKSCNVLPLNNRCCKPEMVVTK